MLALWAFNVQFVENHLITAVLVIVGILLVALYARRQLRLDEPMLRVGILKTRNYRTVVIIVMIFQAALIGMETIMPLYIQGVLGHSATVSGLALMPGAVIGAITGFFAGRIFDRYGVRKPVLVGAVVITAAVVGFGFFAVDSSIVFVSAAYALLAIGMQFTMTPLNTWGVNSLSNDVIQHAQSTSNTLNQVAGSFGAALLVSVSAAVSNASVLLAGVERTFAGYHASFDMTAALAIIAVIVIVAFVRDRKTARGAAKSESASFAAAEDAYPNGLADAAGSACAFDPKVAAASVLVRDAMNPNAATVPATAPMSQVVDIMATTDTTGVSVVNADGTLVGYVTDGDVAHYLARIDRGFSIPSGNVAAFYRDDDDMRKRMAELAQLNVMRLATKRVIAVEDDLPLDKACALLWERRIKKVPVTHDGVLVGALSRRNIMHYLMCELERG